MARGGSIAEAEITAPAETMSTDTAKTTPEKGKRGAKKGVPRPIALIADLNFEDVAAEEDLKRRVPVRKSKWNEVLGKLYDATAADKIRRNSNDSSLMFTRIGAYTNVNGARVQAKAFQNVETTNATYEFKHTVRDDGSDLWARVREIPMMTDVKSVASAE